MSGGKGVTMSLDGTFTVFASGELALPELLDFSVAKFLINLKRESDGLIVDELHLLSFNTHLF